MRRNNKLFAFTTMLFFAFVLGTFSHVSKNTSVAKADVAPNATFSHIFDDSWNNISNGQSEKKVLLCYDGVAHGLASDSNIDSATIGNKILLNGLAFSEYGNNARIVAWGSQPWFQVIYPSSAVAGGEGATLEIVSGLTVGNSICDNVKFTLNSSGLWARTFTGDVNATFSGIFANDAYNNGSAGTAGYRQVLIVYNGTAQSKEDAPNIINPKKLRNYDNYITIGEHTLASIADGCITGLYAWQNAQMNWFWIKYPESALSGEGTLFVINEGCKFGSVVFERIVLRLNAEEKWEHYSAVEVNSTYQSIHSDEWNNTPTAAESLFNKVLITYTGTPHGNIAPIKTQSELEKYDDYILINGNPISSYPGSQIAVWSNQTWFQIIYPASAVSPGAILTVNEGCKIGDAVFHQFILQLNGVNKWEVYSEKTNYSYTGIADGWNNRPARNKYDYNQLILMFGTYNVDYLANNQTAESTNRATQSYEIGTGLTINDIPIYKIHEKYPDTKVGYDHGKNFVYIQYPTDILLMNKNYLVPTLHIEDETSFMDALLSEVTLKFVGGSWISTNVGDFIIEDPFDYGNNEVIVHYPHQITNVSHAILHSLPAEGCKIAFSINTGDLDVSNAGNAMQLVFYRCTLNIVFKTGTIQLLDNDNGGAVAQQFVGYVFAKNTNYSFEFDISCGVSTTYKFALNHFLVINHTFASNKSGATDLWAIDSSNAVSMDYYEEIVGYLPVIDNSGSIYYDFLEGDPVYNFPSLFNAFDLYDDSVNSTQLEYQYEDGAVTDGKYNAGTWHLTAKLTVDGYEIITKTVTINVHGKLTAAKIYYDDGDPIEVPIGTKLPVPLNPNTYRENGHDYAFDGWYFEGAKWDFENDIVYGDMHLYSRFVPMNPHYIVTVNYVGIERPRDTYSITDGSSLPFEFFDVEGATYEVYQGNNKIVSLVVHDDVTLTVRYTFSFYYVDPVAPTESQDGHIGYWYSPVYGNYYFADSEGREIIDDIVIPRLGQHDYIDDEPVVETSNYKLFTISDYNFANDSTYPLYSPSENIDAMSNSFGFRFNINIPNGRESSVSTVNFSGTDMYGSDALFSATINNGYGHSYLTFNGEIDLSTNEELALTTNTNHLIEIYFIKTSNTSADIFFGVDGELIWKSEDLDISGLTFHNYLSITGSANTNSFYSSATDTASKALNRFAIRQLHSSDVSFSNNTDTGACRGENGYYAKAKEFYNNYLTTNQKQLFASSDDYIQLRDRFIAWGIANGEAISLNPSTGDIMVNPKVNLFIDNSINNNSIIVVVISLLCIVSSLLFIVVRFRHKKEDNR